MKIILAQVVVEALFVLNAVYLGFRYFWIYDGTHDENSKIYLFEGFLEILTFFGFIAYVFLVIYDRKEREVALDEQNWQTIKSAMFFGWCLSFITLLLADILGFWFIVIDQVQMLVLFAISLCTPFFYMLLARWRGRAG